MVPASSPVVKVGLKTGEPLLSLSSRPFLISPPFPSLPLSLEVGPLNPASGPGERCKLPQWVRAEPVRQTIFRAFGAENASGESNFKGTFTKNMFVFSLFTSSITYGGKIGHVISCCILSQFVQFVIPLSLGLLSSPTLPMTQFCLMLNIDWTPLFAHCNEP